MLLLLWTGKCERVTDMAVFGETSSLRIVPACTLAVTVTVGFTKIRYCTVRSLYREPSTYTYLFKVDVYFFWANSFICFADDAKASHIGCR